MYQLSKGVSLDESAIGWCGNIRFKVYNSTKLRNFQVKVYVLAEGMSGYITEYEIYEGKNNNISPKGAT